MTKFNPEVVLLSNAISSHKAGVKFETKVDDLKAKLDDLNSNKEKHFVKMLNIGKSLKAQLVEVLRKLRVHL